jgi:hypothetical protein
MTQGVKDFIGYGRKNLLSWQSCSTCAYAFCCSAFLVTVDTLEYACVRIQKQSSQTPLRAEMTQRLAAAQTQYDAAEAAAEDFELIASLGKALQALQQESAKLPLSEEDYLSLRDRHAALVRRVEERCKELKDAKDFTALEALGVHLEALKAVHLPPPQVPAAKLAMPAATVVTPVASVATPAATVTKPAVKKIFGALFGLGAPKASPDAVQAPTVAVTAPTAAPQPDLNGLLSSFTELSAECNRLCVQASQAPQRAEMMQRLEAAQAQYDAAVSAFTDLSLITSLGKSLQSLQLQSALLPLSEEDYLTLSIRHADLVQRVEQGCKTLAVEKQLDSLATLGGQLKLLKAHELPRACATKGTPSQT